MRWKHQRKNMNFPHIQYIQDEGSSSSQCYIITTAASRPLSYFVIWISSSIIFSRVLKTRDVKWSRENRGELEEKNEMLHECNSHSQSTKLHRKSYFLGAFLDEWRRDESMQEWSRLEFQSRKRFILCVRLSSHEQQQKLLRNTTGFAKLNLYIQKMIQQHSSKSRENPEKVIVVVYISISAPPNSQARVCVMWVVKFPSIRVNLALSESEKREIGFGGIL